MGLESGVSIQKGSDAQSQNMKFCDQQDDFTCTIKSAIESTRMGQDTVDAELGNFFSRPLKIGNFVWPTGTAFATSFNPWFLYFSNSRVANRITNFNLLRCNLHLKFVINGNSFLYGKAIAAYLPMEMYDFVSDLSSVAPYTLVQQSQFPHIYIDPTMSRGGEMVLPFFFHQNNLTVPTEEWSEMGLVLLRQLNNLKHANGATQNISISVFAWAEDVHLSVLTSRTQATLPPQMGIETDEANAKGVISGPATTVAAVAASLSSVPVIGPYAMATSKAATGVAGIAKILGYSRPTITASPLPLNPVTHASIANTTTPDTVSKLTVDDKQELTIDPRVTGISAEDPLVITNISTRETYLTNFKWQIGNPSETFLWNCRVSPMLWAYNPVAFSYHFPACAMAALPFKYWTGSIKFRFQFVVSSFHKGRVRIVYDPHWLATDEYNINYMEIVDIADKADFTISIANGQAVSLLTRHEPGVDSVTQLYSTTKFLSKEQGNGVIGVYVVNELTTPNSTVNNDIEVNVFVSTGEDFQVFVPTDSYSNFVFKPQMGFEIADAENSDEKDAPAQMMSSELGSMQTPNTDLTKVFIGESIGSFRSLLKRYSLHTSIGPAEPNSHKTLWYKTSGFPYYRGKVSGAIHTTSLGAPYTYCNTLLLHWITMAFQGWRGSIRRKIFLKGSRSVDATPPFMSVQLTENDYYGYSGNISSVATSTAGAAYLSVKTSLIPAKYTQVPLGTLGSALTSGRLHDTLEFEVPFFSEYRMVPGKTLNWTTSAIPRVRPHGFETIMDSTWGTTCLANFYVATGEDFQVYMFTGLPPMYYESAPPAPS
jgi:hypothetical protein